MTSVEVELVSAIYALYAYECLYWLKETETAYTRLTTGGWRAWAPHSNGFALLRRRPCVVNLLPFRAGLARLEEAERNPARSLRKTEAEISRARWLLTAASLEAAVLLGFAPAVIAAGALHALWPRLVAVLFPVHATTVVLFHHEIRHWETDSRARAGYLFAAWVNPAAAVRCADVLAGRIFAAVLSPKPAQD